MWPFLGHQSAGEVRSHFVTRRLIHWYESNQYITALPKLMALVRCTATINTIQLRPSHKLAAISQSSKILMGAREGYIYSQTLLVTC